MSMMSPPPEADTAPPPVPVIATLHRVAVGAAGPVGRPTPQQGAVSVFADGFCENQRVKSDAARPLVILTAPTADNTALPLRSSLRSSLGLTAHLPLSRQLLKSEA